MGTEVAGVVFVAGAVVLSLIMIVVERKYPPKKGE